MAAVDWLGRICCCRYNLSLNALLPAPLPPYKAYWRAINFTLPPAPPPPLLYRPGASSPDVVPLAVGITVPVFVVAAAAAALIFLYSRRMVGSWVSNQTN